MLEDGTLWAIAGPSSGSSFYPTDLFQGTLQASNGTLSSSTISGFGGATITYSAMDVLNLKLGSGNDSLTLNTAGSALAPTISLGAGDDSVVVTSLGAATTVPASTGNDVVRVVYPNTPTTAFNNLNFSVKSGTSAGAA